MLLAVIAAFVQGIAAFLFSNQGCADPSHAKRAIGRLLALAERVSSAERSACGNFERNITANQRRDIMGALSVELSWIGEEVRSSVLDWIVFNDRLAELVSDEDRQAALTDASESKKADSPQPARPAEISGPQLDEPPEAEQQERSDGVDNQAVMEEDRK